MKIGELAKRSGLTASRIRFYESNGLLQKAERQANGYRDYPPEALMVLEVITSAQQAGFTLDEVRSLMPTGSESWAHERLIVALEQKVAGIVAMENRLAQNRAHLIALIADIRYRPEGLDCADNAKRLLGRMRNGVLAMASTGPTNVANPGRVSDLTADAVHHSPGANSAMQTYRQRSCTCARTMQR